VWPRAECLEGQALLVQWQPGVFELAGFRPALTEIRLFVLCGCTVGPRQPCAAVLCLVVAWLAVLRAALCIAGRTRTAWCRLTFEVSWRQRQDAKPKPQKMYTVPVAWAWWPAVGAQLDRGVRRRQQVVARH
jgi:hypothetical protein